MKKRRIGKVEVPAIGLGCMNLSHAYGTPPSSKVAVELLHKAFDLGVRHFDTAALYGFGSNESIVGEAIKPFRQKIHLASKCGMTGVDGKRVIDGRPDVLVKTLDEALTRLQTDHIDLYYLHRWDKNVPIEDSVGALSRMVEAGKIGAIGLSEVSAATLRKAHNVHPIAAVQTEYSLWTRNAEIGVLRACKELAVTFVAFSPVARGFLTGSVIDTGLFSKKDIRRNMPRFQAPYFGENQVWLSKYAALADSLECSMAQLALAWLLAKGEHILPIPGTTSVEHLEANLKAVNLSLPRRVINSLDAMINEATVRGARYPSMTQSEIDTEEF